MTKPANVVIDRAMWAAFKAWQDDMVSRGQTSALNAKFDDIAPRDRRLIELQCRAAIASLKELDGSHPVLIAGAQVMPDYDPGTDDAKRCMEAMIDAALKP